MKRTGSATKKTAKTHSKTRAGETGQPLTKAGKPLARPLERAVLFKPDRLKYIRKVGQPAGCVFCAALAKAELAKAARAASSDSGADRAALSESLVLYQGQHAFVIMNKYPYNSGHLLILPKRHEGDLLKLTDDELFEIAVLQRRCVEILNAANQPVAKGQSPRIPGVNIGLNLGAAAGAGIPDHLHVHIVPRWNGDTNFFPLIAETKVVAETLEQTFERLLPYFNESKGDF